MTQMNFDLEDGLPPVRFSLKEEDAERFCKFMDECHVARAKELEAVPVSSQGAAQGLSDEQIAEMRRAAKDDPRCADEHWYVLFARAIEAATRQAPQLSERTPQDYAIEHAEYMAKKTERLMEALNDEDALRLRREEGDDVDDDAMYDASATRDEASSALRNGIYEFRKRALRAAIKDAT